MSGEEVRVGLAEEGSIGEAEVREFFVAERGADLIHVAGRVRGVDER